MINELLLPLNLQIIRIFDVFIPDGNQETMTNIYIVMEYMEHSLRDVSTFFSLFTFEHSSVLYIICLVHTKLIY